MKKLYDLLDLIEWGMTGAYVVGGVGCFYLYRNGKQCDLAAVSGPNSDSRDCNGLLGQLDTIAYLLAAGFASGVVIGFIASCIWPDGEEDPAVISRCSRSLKL